MQGDFTLSYHFYKQRDSRNHLELFLDVDGKSPLETWHNFKETQPKHRFVAAPAHRRVYLEYTGTISGGRGRLRILRRGKFIDRRTGGPRSSGGMEGTLTDDRRARTPEVGAAHDVHQGADRRTRGADAIKVRL